MVGAQGVDNDEDDVSPARTRGRLIGAARRVLFRIAACGREMVDGVTVDIAGSKQRVQREAQRLVLGGRRPGKETIELEPARQSAGNDDQGHGSRRKGACREPRPIEAAEVQPRRAE